jgi:tetratricopeptide (TPR) repeat protein
MVMLGRLFGFVALLTVVSMPVHAKWHESSSDHFVIYSDQSADSVRKFSERLERFHGAMSYFLKLNSKKPSPSNRVTIYVVRDKAEVRKLLGGDNKFAAGFYIPRAGGSIAIIPKVESGETDWDVSGEDILYHEYAHHFMYSVSSQSYPLWLSEGFAEFYAKVKFERDGSVGLGLPATQRLLELAYSVNVPIEQLLDTKAYRAKKSSQHDEFYGRSWTLFHYLTFAENRKGQLAKYMQLINQRTPEFEAAKMAFGDLTILDKELARYNRQSRLAYIKIAPSALNVGTISVRALDDGEAAIMPIRIRSKRGVNQEKAQELVPDARKIAAQFPGNAAVLAALAEVEYDAKNDLEAIAAAEAALAVDPKTINALLQKSFAMARQAETVSDTKERSKAWRAVRDQLLKINAIESEHPLPLMQYYLTFKRNGSQPTKNSVEGLEWALELAPFDIGLRFTTAQQQMNEQRFDDAITTLRPIANHPHKTDMAEAAQKLIDAALAAKPSGRADQASTATD